MFTNIALYIDPELNNQSMIDCVLPIALATNAKVTLLGVVKPLAYLARMSISTEVLSEINNELVAETQKTMDQVAESLQQSGLKVNTSIAKGETFVELIRQVLRCNFDLLAILSAKKQIGLSESFFGSTQMHLLRKCPCPVWLIKSESKTNINNILTPIDAGSEELSEIYLNNNLVKVTKTIQAVSKASVRFLYVWSVYGEGYMSARGGMSEESVDKMRKEEHEQCQQRLNSYTEEEDWTNSTMDMELINSNYASTEIINKVKEKNIDLLVMGTVCRTGIAGFFIGNTAEKVLTEVSCSVLAFKPQDFVSPVTLDNNKP